MILASCLARHSDRVCGGHADEVHHAGHVGFGLPAIGMSFVEVEDAGGLLRLETLEEHDRIVAEPEPAHAEAGSPQDSAHFADDLENLLFGLGIGMIGGEYGLVVEQENSRTWHAIAS
jgi:hypothetical protein